MKFFLAFVLGMTLASSSFAGAQDCRSILTNNFENASAVFTVNLDELEITAPVADKMGQAVQILRHIVSKQGCTRADISFGRGSESLAKSKCSMITPDRTASLGCYVESNLGYFFVHWDMGHTANVIFNQWD